jgi:hypothetical protein
LTDMVLSYHRGLLLTVSEVISQKATSSCSCNAVSGKSIKNWILELKRDGFKPGILEIETVVAKEANETENFYIQYFRMLGAALINSKFNKIHSRKIDEFVPKLEGKENLQPSLNELEVA